LAERHDVVEVKEAILAAAFATFIHEGAAPTGS
jgi:hypothetical protein